ncbi:MAG: glycosyltransferase family 2 protein [Flavobacteriaceae bacterium]|nr:glycosyltransferase family 2 protein [Flavobacteriaceae bacterium]
MKLSIVSTLYFSEKYIVEFYERISVIANKYTDDFEIIFVNDGSNDSSNEIVVGLHRKDSRVKLVELSRNFGHHKAIMTGLRKATGERVFLIDVDLEEEPELLHDFWDVMDQEKDVDVVYGVQECRKGRLNERLTGRLFYKIFNWLSDTPIPENYLTVRLMTNSYVSELTSYGETQFNFSILTELTGFKQMAVSVKKNSTSETTYTLSKKIVLLVDAITSSSSKPLYLVFAFGSVVTALSCSYILKILFDTLILGRALEGWPSLIVSIWFLGGVLSMFLGVVGLYISRIYIETKKRPYIHIKSTIGL